VERDTRQKTRLQKHVAETLSREVRFGNYKGVLCGSVTRSRNSDYHQLCWATNWAFYVFFSFTSFATHFT